LDNKFVLIEGGQGLGEICVWILGRKWEA